MRGSKTTQRFRKSSIDLAHYVGRPSPLYEASRLSDAIGGARILLKREDLNHTGAHKVNNTIGQALLAKYMGKKRVIAETVRVSMVSPARRLRQDLTGVPCLHGRGRHSQTGAECISNEALRAQVVSVTSGSRTLKDAMNGDARLGHEC